MLISGLLHGIADRFRGMGKSHVFAVFFQLDKTFRKLGDSLLIGGVTSVIQCLFHINPPKLNLCEHKTCEKSMIRSVFYIYAALPFWKRMYCDLKAAKYTL